MRSSEKPPTPGAKLRVFPREGPPSSNPQYAERYKELHRAVFWLLLIAVLANTAPITILPGCPYRIYRLVHLSWMILWYGSFVLGSYFEFVLITTQRLSLDRYLSATESAIYVVHIFSIMLLTWQCGNWAPKVMRNIVRSDIDRAYTIDSNRTKRFIRLHMFLVGIFTCLAIFFNIWTQKCLVYRSILSINSYVMPNIISSISFIQYYLLLQGIAWRQRKLTESLERELFHLHSPRISEVQKIRKHHADLIDFTKVVNRTFQYSILLLFVGCFLNFNLVLFLVYQGIENPSMADLAKWLSMLLWLALHVGKVCCILYFNQTIQDEHFRCLTALSRVSCTRNDLQDAITHYIIQMRTNVRQHLVCGVINLDLKFLTSLLVASADFFIFLLQYDVTYEALSKSVQGNVTRNQS